MNIRIDIIGRIINIGNPIGCLEVPRWLTVQISPVKDIEILICSILLTNEIIAVTESNVGARFADVFIAVSQ
jgi:hypothetical protein